MAETDFDTIPQLDLRGYQCPLPVLKTRKRMSTMADGEKLWVLTDDPLASLDIPNFCNESGNTLIEQETVSQSSHRFLLCRGQV